ncbi:conserved hypothetical protein [Desulfonispora thiosulfatigenes DSM 11270]|uniref:Uncharacterized protein n=1 Tax=Desulfonispora thiosulfatigenes DSM 11270 TaxID=656914 RepID=A0A1W1VCL9_DESTI|nr:hypothetical protein [Desulfonispora thiosulfatigenes]SMB91149.1 conserved hypothetical protein [Desulfonispora thiosulfatigenes DSM 11270]
MTTCEKAAKCPYANLELPLDQDASKKYADNYCFGDFNSCARLKVCNAIGKPNVPRDLYPDQHEAADALIKAINPSWTTEA